MSAPVISVENLGKKYSIGQAKQEQYQTLRDVMAGGARSLMSAFGKRASAGNGKTEDFWALRGIDFEVKPGEVVGIIGRNGAGKSTLLKVLSRITEPTEGQVQIRGRVASLLEVGTGFHPELTGRENIYLNGAILGMGRAEIRRKFDEIVAFAEVERFLDTPVKRYSSGMYVRLAFAVAAHLEPEILVVDEVLAVGDAEFQKKCLGKMQDVAGHGRTILFVSHNMDAVASLCSRSIFFRSGQIVYAGDNQECIKRYLADGNAPTEEGGQRSAVPVTDGLWVQDFALDRTVVPAWEDLNVRLVLSANRDRYISDLSVVAYHADGTRVFLVDLRKYGVVPRSVFEGETVYDISLANLNLVEGDYTLGLYMAAEGYYGEIKNLANFQVILDGSAGTHTSYEARFRGYGLLKAEVSCSAAGAS